MDEKRLDRIEAKLDAALAAHSAAQAVSARDREMITNRVTKLEAEAGFIKAGLALAVTVVLGACTWAFRKVFG